MSEAWPVTSSLPSGAQWVLSGRKSIETETDGAFVPRARRITRFSGQTLRKTHLPSGETSTPLSPGSSVPAINLKPDPGDHS